MASLSTHVLYMTSSYPSQALFPHTLLWRVQATHDQHLLITYYVAWWVRAQICMLKYSSSAHKFSHFFAHTHAYTCTYVCVMLDVPYIGCTCLHPYFGQLFLFSVAVA